MAMLQAMAKLGGCLGLLYSYFRCLNMNSVWRIFFYQSRCQWELSSLQATNCLVLRVQAPGCPVQQNGSHQYGNKVSVTILFPVRQHSYPMSVTSVCDEEFQVSLQQYLNDGWVHIRRVMNNTAEIAFNNISCQLPSHNSTS